MDTQHALQQRQHATILEVWGYKSALSSCQDNLELVQWDLSKKHPLPWDYVPMASNEVQRHLDDRSRYGAQTRHTVAVHRTIVQRTLQRASLRMGSWPISDKEANLLLTASGFKSLVSESEALLTVVVPQYDASNLCNLLIMTFDEAQGHTQLCPVYANEVLQRFSEFRERVKELLEIEVVDNDESISSGPFSDDVTVTSSGSDEENESEDDGMSIDSFVVDDDASLIYDSDAD
jgi:hypothetical protein